MARLDDMTISDVKELYDKMFNNLIDTKTLNNTYIGYLEKYNKMKMAEKKGYSVVNSMGRKFNYLKNILYGWYIEDLFYILIGKNPLVLSIEKTGNDSEHLFIYDDKDKKIRIKGLKTTIPDFLITMKNGKKVYLELKSSAVEVYSIKAGNVKQLQKTMGTTGIYSMIIMIDLVNELYDIKDIKFFLNSFPFVNQRMEGQLCYDFPTPSKKFSEIMLEDFSLYIDKNVFNSEDIIKYKCLAIARKKENKKMIYDIKNKISLDELQSEFEFQQNEFNKKVDKLIEKSPNIEFKKWNDILNELDS